MQKAGGLKLNATQINNGLRSASSGSESARPAENPRASGCSKSTSARTCFLQWPRSAAGFVWRKSSKGPLRRTSLTKNLRRAESWPLAVPADTTPKKQELQNVLGSMNQVESSLV